jgi:hypothetical protein
LSSIFLDFSLKLGETTDLGLIKKYLLVICYMAVDNDPFIDDTMIYLVYPSKMALFQFAKR